MSAYTTPDLASILQTLSAYAPAPQPEFPPAGCPYQQQAPPSQLEEGELPYEPPYEPSDLPYEPPYEPPPAVAPINPTPTTYQPPPLQHPHSQSQPALQQQHQTLPQQQPHPHPPPKSQQQQQPPLPPPTTVTTYPAALRHITLLLSRSPTTLPRIKHLIQTQRTHEQQWWASRQALLQKHQCRASERRKLDGVLSAVGGHVASFGNEREEKEGEKMELELFDRKVWRACREMVDAMGRELAGLGVPFFGAEIEAGKGEAGKIDEEELKALRRRVVEFLEDLCRD